MFKLSHCLRNPTEYTLPFIADPPGESVASSSSYNFVRLAFKNGGMKDFTSKIHESLSQRRWQQMVIIE